jgi:hypothetical protein
LHERNRPDAAELAFVDLESVGQVADSGPQWVDNTPGSPSEQDCKPGKDLRDPLVAGTVRRRLTQLGVPVANARV